LITNIYAMIRFIELTSVDEQNATYTISINIDKINYMQESGPAQFLETTILLDNGQQVYVTEDISEITDFINGVEEQGNA